MPNLIIKAQTGSGNSVILQDQAGGAVLTTANSGVSQLSTPAGHIIQIKNMTNTESDQSWASGGQYAEPTDCEISITPAHADNKILVSAMCTVGFSAGGAGQMRVQRKITSGGTYGNPTVYKSSSSSDGDAIGDASGNFNRSQVGGIYNQVDAGTTYTQFCSWLDTPATALEVFYRWEIWRDEGTLYLNRPGEHPGNNERAVGMTGITLMEVKV